MAAVQPGPGTLWADGRIGLRLDDQPPRWIDRPFARIGGTAGVDLRLTGREVHARHAYLHLDHRGLFALDLTGRAGLRIDGLATPAGWLAPGRGLEIAGHRIEIVGAEIDGTPLPFTASPPDHLLTETAPTPLIRVELDPIPAAACPWTLDSELVVLGRAPSCGIAVAGLTAAWVHAVIVRTAAAAFVVNLAGSGLDRNGRPVREATALADGDVLGLGSSRFGVRLQPTPEPLPAALAVAAPAWPVELLPPPPADLVPTAARTHLLAWMMGALQTLQAEMLRRQDAFQRELVQALRDLHRDQQESLAAHQVRVEAIQQELAVLHDEVRRRLGPAAEVAASPLRPPSLRLETPAPPADPDDAATWLLERMRRLNSENHASWRDLLNRLNPHPGP